jgi:hypothetical protein
MENDEKMLDLENAISIAIVLLRPWVGGAQYCPTFWSFEIRM